MIGIVYFKINLCITVLTSYDLNVVRIFTFNYIKSESSFEIVTWEAVEDCISSAKYNESPDTKEEVKITDEDQVVTQNSAIKPSTDANEELINTAGNQQPIAQATVDTDTVDSVDTTVRTSPVTEVEDDFMEISYSELSRSTGKFQE